MKQYNTLLSTLLNSITTGGTTAGSYDWRGTPAAYRDAYQLRMQKLLENAYPALRHYLGNTAFASLAEVYYTQQPPTHFNLDRYPIGFADHLHSGNVITKEIAHLESSMIAVYLGDESTALSPRWITTQTEASLAASTFATRTASRLFAFTHEVNDYLSTLRAGGNPSAPAAGQNWLYLYRHNRQLQRLSISEGEYHLLTLFTGSMTLAEVLEHESFVPYREKALASGEFLRWFARFSEKGCLCLTS